MWSAAPWQAPLGTIYNGGVDETEGGPNETRGEVNAAEGVDIEIRIKSSSSFPVQFPYLLHVLY